MRFIKAYDKCNNITFINLLKADYIENNLKKKTMNIYIGKYIFKVDKELYNSNTLNTWLEKYTFGTTKLLGVDHDAN